MCVVNPSVMIGAMEGQVDEQLAAKTKHENQQLTCLVSFCTTAVHGIKAVCAANEVRLLHRIFVPTQ